MSSKGKLNVNRQALYNSGTTDFSPRLSGATGDLGYGKVVTVHFLGVCRTKPFLPNSALPGEN